MNPPTEIRLKAWLIDEAAKHGVSTQTIYVGAFVQPHKGYPGLKIRRVSKRTVFVQLPAPERVLQPLGRPTTNPNA